MFAWGELVGELAGLVEAAGTEFSWRNFWDPHDPVGDPLNPAADWRPGDPVSDAPGGDDGLLVARDPSGHRHHVPVIDTQVDNIDHSSGGGLQAHDYCNNQPDFVTPLGDLLAQLGSDQPAPATPSD